MQAVDCDVIMVSFVHCGIVGHRDCKINSSVDYAKLHSRLRSLVDPQFACIPSSDEEDVLFGDDDDGQLTQLAIHAVVRVAVHLPFPFRFG